VEAVAYRQAGYGNPLRTEPARRPARFHAGSEETPTQYLCLHPLGPFAELMRAHDLRAEEQLQLVRARTWALRLDFGELPEIGFENATDFGIGPGELVADDQAACRELGARLRKSVRGLVVPSAALPGTKNVVLFGPRVGSPYLLPAAGAVDVPASVTAEGGRPLSSVLEHVRFRGMKHPELVAWLRGDAFEFEEPDWAA
jgi:hypothetical protein